MLPMFEFYGNVVVGGCCGRGSIVAGHRAHVDIRRHAHGQFAHGEMVVVGMYVVTAHGPDRRPAWVAAPIAALLLFVFG